MIRHLAGADLELVGVEVYTVVDGIDCLEPFDRGELIVTVRRLAQSPAGFVGEA